ncbi:MAG: AmmeMemoRadiSam system protein A [Deltaproteobacteria bacterium]|nr:AmmeMemoRadiSam system protein A [Deltaproteobacteria bacterium]
MSTLRLLPLLLILGAVAASSLPAPPSWGEETAMSVSEADKKRLFELARASIRAHLKRESIPSLEGASPLLCEPRGVFVSLHRQGRLRGCIGYLEAVKPLGQAVVEMAAAAAFHDPRFRPLGQEELADLEVEISVLTPMQRLDQVENIEVGKHGLYIEKGSSRGLLLPQVAVEYRWDRTTFLEQTCCKAGLPHQAWKDPDTRIYTFTADIFSDHPAPPGPRK